MDGALVGIGLTPSKTVRGHANKFAPPSHISLIDVKFNLPHNTYIRYYVHTYKTNLVAMGYRYSMGYAH